MTSIAAALARWRPCPCRARPDRGSGADRGRLPQRPAGSFSSIRRRSTGGSTRAGEDFDAYWAKRPAQLRNTAKRKAKAAGLEIDIHDRFDEAAWADYEAVYRASWKPDEGSFPFLRALAEQEGAAGTLRLGVARKDGRPVAVQLWLVENGEATIHKLAYAEDAKALSPGTILGMAMFRHALDKDRVRRIDYGTGDEPYKADWMAEKRTAIPPVRLQSAHLERA